MGKRKAEESNINQIFENRRLQKALQDLVDSTLKQERIARALKKQISKEITGKESQEEIKEILSNVIDKSEDIYTLLSIHISRAVKRNKHSV